MTDDATRHCREVIAHHSKSFALASRLLPSHCGDEVAAVYAWCRHADDTVDLVRSGEASDAVRRLRAELDGIYAGHAMGDPALEAFQVVVTRRAIPRCYADELLEGMAMDLGPVRYETMDELLRYSFRVAGTVGLMMCHVMGLRDAAARRRAAHLGIAMQLTNICRDVVEDWDRGRLYLPEERLAPAGAPGLGGQLGRPFPVAAREPVAHVVGELLDEADRYYRSGDIGLGALSWRCAIAVRAARLVYSAIGGRLARVGHDVTRGRVWVPTPAKLGHVVRAATGVLCHRAAGLGRTMAPVRLDFATDLPPLSFPRDVLPV